MRTMAPRVHLLWCALACAAWSTAERVLADPANFVVVQGLARVCVEITVAASARWRGSSPIDSDTGESSSEY